MAHTYIITGCSSGIGLTLTRDLIAAGHQVYGITRRRPDITSELFHFVHMDLAQPCSFGSLHDQIPTVTGIICAAGVMKGDALPDLNPNDLRAMWQIHVQSHVELIQAMAPRLVTRGRIVMIGSRVSTGAAQKSAYAATKSALIGFARSVAIELAAREITVNVVSPAATDTPMLRDPNRAHVTPKLPPMGRLIDPCEVSGTVQFLLSDAARSITGQNIVICAGSSL